MSEEMSTQNEKKLWEEKILTGPEKNCLNNIDNEQRNTTNVIKNDLIPKACKDTGKISGIYKIINKVNGKYYIGSSNDILGKSGRWQEHRNDLTANRHKNKHLQRAWIKYGENRFDFLIIENVIETQLLAVEQKYLDVAKSEKENCYNTKFIAGGGSTKDEWTEERRKNMSISLKGRIIDDKWRENLKKAAKTKNISEETKKRISEHQRKRMLGNKLWTGRKHNEKTIEKMKKTQQSLIGKIKVLKMEENPNFDHTIYHFVNTKTNEEFKGPKRRFMEKTGYDKYTVKCIISGLTTNRKGWFVISDKD